MSKPLKKENQDEYEDADKRRDAALFNALKMPPAPFTPKPKPTKKKKKT